MPQEPKPQPAVLFKQVEFINTIRLIRLNNPFHILSNLITHIRLITVNARRVLTRLLTRDTRHTSRKATLPTSNPNMQITPYLHSVHRISRIQHTVLRRTSGPVNHGQNSTILRRSFTFLRSADRGTFNHSLTSRLTEEVLQKVSTKKLKPLNRFLLSLIVVRHTTVPVRNTRDIMVLRDLKVVLSGVARLQIVLQYKHLNRVHTKHLTTVEPNAIRHIRSHTRNTATQKTKHRHHIVVHRFRDLSRRVKKYVRRLLLFLIGLIFYQGVAKVPMVFHLIRKVHMPIHRHPTCNIRVLAGVSHLVLMYSLNHIVNRHLISVNLTKHNILAYIRVNVGHGYFVVLRLRRLAYSTLTTPPKRILKLSTRALRDLSHTTVPVERIRVNNIH